MPKVKCILCGRVLRAKKSKRLKIGSGCAKGVPGYVEKVKAELDGQIRLFKESKCKSQK